MALDKESLDALKIDPEDRVTRGPGWLLPALIVAVAAVAGAGYFFFKPGATTLPEVRTVTAAGPSVAGDSAVLNASGYVVARRIATVSSKVTGKIVDVFVEEGLQVTEGDELARLDDSTVQALLALGLSELDAARAALDETRVRLAEARRDLDRKAALRADRLVSEADLDAAQSQVNALEARLTSASSNVAVNERRVGVIQQDMDNLTIRAPFTGIVISKDAQPGEMISPVSAGGSFTRSGICTIVDMDSREIEVDVNEAYINRVRAGQGVAARLDAYPDWEIPARVINIVPAADRQKATVRVRIAFDSLDDRILPDMGVKVRFLEERVDRPADATPVMATVPSEAVTGSGDERYVWVLSGETVEKRAVRLGETRGASREIVAGLRPGERVVVSDRSALNNGQRVRIQ